MSLPALSLAAEQKKELTEEEEIALMMEQLEQFKSSWERKEDQPAPVKPAAKPAAPAPAVKPAPAIKITTPQPAPVRPAQIKTQDGRILGTAPAPKAEPSQAPAPVVEKKAEVSKPKAAPMPVPPVEAPKAVIAEPKPAPEPVPSAAEEPVLDEPVEIELEQLFEEPVEEPVQQEMSAPEKEISAPEPEPAAEAAESEVVVIEDDAALYRAAREQQSAEPKSAREKAASRGPAIIEDARVVESDETKVLGRREGVVLPGDTRGARKPPVRRGGKPEKKEPPKPNLFADTFFLNQDQRLAYDVYDIDGFIFVKSPNPALNTKYAIVTGFGGGAMRTRAVPDLQTLEDAKLWVKSNLQTDTFETVEIKKLSVGKNAEAKDLYWVGHKAYSDYETAKQEVAMMQSVVTSRGEDFTQMVSEAAAYIPPGEEKKPVEIKGPANFEREEELMLKYLDQMDIGEKLFGPFQGDASGESFTWQSFGETTWRKTNLDKRNFEAQVGFWTNRVVFKGIRFPMNTVDPFLESTISMEAHGADFASNMKLFAGLEWRPFARNPWLFNYRPWGGINILEWIKNYRFYVMYGDRKNIKDPIAGSDDHDLIAGVQIFYEWGVELPPLDQPEPEDFSDFVERYFWGEYFGNYRHEMTNFGSEEDYDGWLFNSSLILGVKLPGIPLPANPINDELMLMPYMRFEHTNSDEFSFPYQNQYLVAAGIRWMPFRNYRFKENEWLSKTKLFGEYVGVGRVQHAKQDGEAPNAIRWDLRFGVSFSSRRY